MHIFNKNSLSFKSTLIFRPINEQLHYQLRKSGIMKALINFYFSAGLFRHMIGYNFNISY